MFLKKKEYICIGQACSAMRYNGFGVKCLNIYYR